MKALFVIDMQEAYVGTRRNAHLFDYDAAALLDAVNARIRHYTAQGLPVIYIRNRFFLQRRCSPLVAGLDVVSGLIFDKWRMSCFTSPRLTRFVRSHGITEIEIVGVDGNHCAGHSALAARRQGLEVVLSRGATGISRPAAFSRMHRRLQRAGIQLAD